MEPQETEGNGRVSQSRTDSHIYRAGFPAVTMKKEASRAVCTKRRLY